MYYEVKYHTIDKKLPFFLLILTIVFSYYYIDVGFSIKPYMILSVLFFVIYLKRFVIHKLIAHELLLLLFLMYFSMTGLFARYSEYSLRLILGLFLIVFCYFVFRYIVSITSVENIEKYIVFGGILLNTVSLMAYFLGAYKLGFNFQSNGIESFGLVTDRGVPRLIGIMKDPNIISYYNLLFFFYYLTHLDRKWSKTGILLTASSIILAFSRGGLLALLVGFLVLFLFSNLGKKIKFVFYTPVISFIIHFIIKIALGINVFEVIKNRFLSLDGGSGRSVIWEYGIHFFKENPLFGIGIFNFQPYTKEVFGNSAHLHNTYMDALIEGGILGLFLFLILLLSIIITYLYYRKEIMDNGYLILTIVSMVVFMSTYSLIANEMFYFVLALFWRYLLEVDKRASLQ